MKSLLTLVFTSLFILSSCANIHYNSSSCDKITDETVALSEGKTIIKDFDETVDGFDYLAFGGAITFGDSHIFAVRAAYEHIPRQSRADGWGCVFIYYSDDDIILHRKKLKIDYDSLDGELRDINLSKTSDDNYLLLSAIAYNPRGTSFSSSFLFVIDKDFKIISQIQIGGNGFLTWGNCIQDDEGFLIKTGYIRVNNSPMQDQAVVMRSSKSIRDGFENISFIEVYRFTNPSVINECCLTRIKEKLFLISRADGYNGVILETDDLTGMTGWSEPFIFPVDIKSPAVLQSYDSTIIEFLATVVVQTSPIQIRYPAMFFYNTVSRTIERKFFIDNTLSGAGGYPAFVKLSDVDYRVMYYDDLNNSSSALYYMKFNLLLADMMTDNVF